jgi:Acyl-CoA carboxylase epsilon subunit
VAEVPPYLQVVRGDATPEEIAALIGTLSALATARVNTAREITARANAAAAARPGPVPGWTDRSRLLRTPVHPSPGGWRRSALP